MPLLALLAIVWVGLIAAAPFLPLPAAGMLYLLGSRVCHQNPERSFHLAGAQLPVCARCIGIYAGVAIAALLTVASPPLLARATRGQRRSVHVAVLAVAAALNAATVVLEWAGAWHPSHNIRAAAGAVLGCAVTLVVVGALRKVDYGRCPSPPPIASDPPGTRT